MSDNKDEEKDYDLYTEHIVKEPWKKIKRLLKKGGLIILIAIIFGLVAGLVMLVVYKTGKPFIEKESESEITEAPTETESETEEPSSEETTVTIAPIESTENTTEATTEPINDEALKQYSDYFKSMNNVAEKVNNSMVTVTVINENVDWFNSTYQNTSEDFGLVVAGNDEAYFILTDYAMVRNAGNIKVTYPDGVKENATLVAGDATTNIAIIKSETVIDQSVSIAEIADSTSVSKGDVIIAVGKLYGFAGSVGYGIATGVDNTVNDTDSFYRLINTDIAGEGSPSGVLANIHGEVIGVITTSYNSGNSNLITGYASSDVFSLIERLSNGQTTAYLGIKGLAITDELAESYDIPYGIYVSAVEANSPAFSAGIQTGDVICEINNKKITTMEEFMIELNSCRTGDTISVMVNRKGREEYKTIEFNLMLGVE